MATGGPHCQRLPTVFFYHLKNYVFECSPPLFTPYPLHTLFTCNFGRYMFFHKLGAFENCKNWALFHCQNRARLTSNQNTCTCAFILLARMHSSIQYIQAGSIAQILALYSLLRRHSRAPKTLFWFYSMKKSLLCRS